MLFILNFIKISFWNYFPIAVAVFYVFNSFKEKAEICSVFISDRDNFINEVYPPLFWNWLVVLP